MRLSNDNSVRLREALSKVRRRAESASQGDDLTEIQERLTSVRDACIQAQALVRQMEDETRAQALRAYRAEPETAA